MLISLVFAFHNQRLTGTLLIYGTGIDLSMLFLIKLLIELISSKVCVLLERGLETLLKKQQCNNPPKIQPT